MGIADFATITNVLLGFASILAASRGRLELAPLLILVAVVADGLDGYLARRFGSGPLGGDLDSLADALSFGAAPALLVALKFESLFYLFFPAMFVVCGVLRLARFNVHRVDGGFQGIPITYAGLTTALYLLVFPDSQPLLAGFLLLLSLLMISTIPYPKVRNPRISLPLGSLLLLTAISHFAFPMFTPLLSLLLLLVTLAYLFSPLLKLYFIRRLFF